MLTERIGVDLDRLSLTLPPEEVLRDACSRVLERNQLADQSKARIRITVTERPTILLKLIYPVLDSNFDTERIRYGLKWSGWQLVNWSCSKKRWPNRSRTNSGRSVLAAKS